MKRPVRSILPKFTVNRTSREPLHRQIYDCLRQTILQGALPPGCTLPSTRALARNLGVSRNTVLNAYEALLLEGLLAGKTGSSTRVRNFPDGIRQSPSRKIRDARSILREAHYPSDTAGFHDVDGNVLYMHR